MLESFFYGWTAFTDQFSNKGVGTGICPISPNFFLVKKIDDRPWIVDILSFSKSKPVIPGFYLLFLIAQVVFF